MLRVLARGVLLLALASAACDLTNARTKVANGQLYQAGDAKYDPYFTEVHQEQVAAASWPDDAKAARKPIVSALDLRPGASNTTILSALKEKKSDTVIGHSVDDTVTAERERTRKLGAAAEKLEGLRKRGEELKKQAVEDRRNLAADKADESRVSKANEVKAEVSAAVDAVDGMLEDARKGGREAEELAKRLRGAWNGTNAEEPIPASEPPKEEKKPEPAAAPPKEEKKDEKKKPDPPKKPAKKPAPPPADPPPAAAEPAPKPKPKPPPKKEDEVFTP